jgi:iron complex outermembrane receptor protein
MATDALSFEYGLSYQKGKKDDPLPGQTDTDLADIVPVRANLITNYDFDAKTAISFEVIAQGEWKNFDGDNGEQRLPGFATANLKIKKELTNKLNITLGVDNIFDKAYTPSNTYNDLTLVMAGGTQKVKLNDPGRYAYLNVSYKF